MTNYRLKLESYSQQAARWPAAGRHILAQYDDESVIVYQAYRPAIGRFAAEHGHFGGDFKLDRMSWVKPNFLWMMYRSGWGVKADQEVVLAVRLRRSAFDAILATCVPSRFDPTRWSSQMLWRLDVDTSDVRLLWDPDHDPAGRPLDRRALQLGLRGATLASYAREWILDIEDVSALVAEQRERIHDRGWARLYTPSERIYPVTDGNSAAALQLDRAN
jgi:hypothetical protein